MDVDEITRHLDRLLTREQISDTLLRYARSVDRLDYDGIRAVFHDDADIDYGSMFHGRAPEFVDWLAQVQPQMTSQTHHLSNIAVTMDPDDRDRAGTESYLISRSRMPAKDGGTLELISFARYVDRWARRDGTWRISMRRYLNSADELWPSQTVLFPAEGSRDRNDPSYDVI